MKRLSALLPVFALLVTVLVTGLAACGKGRHEDPILRLSAEEALQIGKELLAAEKYYKAQRHLEHAFEVEPNSRSGREALLLAADALYLKGGPDNYIKCEAKYRDFLNRFPTSERADYAQFQVANCLAERIEKPDRDQQVTQQALAAFEELLRLYPTSPYVDKTGDKIIEVTDRLAMHELVVARFYERYSRRAGCHAVIGRLEDLEAQFPRFSALDETQFRLWAAYSKCDRPEDAAKVREQLVTRFPDSPWVAKLDEKAADIAKELAKQSRAMDERSAKRKGAAKPGEEPAKAEPADDDTGADDAGADAGSGR